MFPRKLGRLSPPLFFCPSLWGELQVQNCRAAYRSQLLEYLTLCGAPTGAIVYMSRDAVEFDYVSLRAKD